MRVQFNISSDSVQKMVYVCRRNIFWISLFCQLPFVSACVVANHITINLSKFISCKHQRCCAWILIQNEITIVINKRVCVQKYNKQKYWTNVTLIFRKHGNLHIFTCILNCTRKNIGSSHLNLCLFYLFLFCAVVCSTTTSKFDAKHIMNDKVALNFTYLYERFWKQAVCTVYTVRCRTLSTSPVSIFLKKGST